MVFSIKIYITFLDVSIKKSGYKVGENLEKCLVLINKLVHEY